MGDFSAVAHDPDGPVVVDTGIPLGVVRSALGAGRWIARPGAYQTCALLVIQDADQARLAHDRGLPVVLSGDEQTLVEELRAFDDGALISTREGEALAWIELIRAEEERNQRSRASAADERVELLQARVDELETHLAAIEASRSWVLTRKLVVAKERLTALVTPWRRHR